MHRLIMLSLVSGLVLTTAAVGQMRDTVYYRDRAAKPEKTSEYVGTVVEETINGIKVKPQVGPERLFGVNDIVDVVYAPPVAQQIPFQQILSGESALRAGGPDKARMALLSKEYTTFLSNIKDPKAVSLRRHVQYRLAMLKAGQAEKREDQLEALNQLDKVRKEVATSWQLLPVTRQQVQILAEMDRLEDAAKVLDATAASPKLSKELQQELELAAIDLMIRAGKANEVAGRIADALKTLPADDALANKLRVYEIGAQAGKGDTEKMIARLKAIIEQAKDPGLIALAYNTLGDCYSAKGKNQDAKWAYLWVDVVYNQDKAEHVKSVERLARVFKDLNDEARAEKYKDKLKSMR